jgi:hypothetical protein
MKARFGEFLASDDTLWVFDGDERIFTSSKDRLLPLMEYLERWAADHQQVTIYDKIIGNAAALLAVKADSREVFSPLGSQLAVETLEKYHVRFHFESMVPCIQRVDGEDMCPMEKLSAGQGPEEFYQAMLALISKARE